MFNLQTHGNRYRPGGQGERLPVQPARPGIFCYLVAAL